MHTRVPPIDTDVPPMSSQYLRSQQTLFCTPSGPTPPRSCGAAAVTLTNHSITNPKAKRSSIGNFAGPESARFCVSVDNSHRTYSTASDDCILSSSHDIEMIDARSHHIRRRDDIRYPTSQSWFCAQNDFVASPLQGGWKDLLDCLCAAPTSKLGTQMCSRLDPLQRFHCRQVRSSPKVQKMHAPWMFVLSASSSTHAVFRAMPHGWRRTGVWLLSRSPSRPECGSWDGCDVDTELHIVYYRLGRCSLSSLQVVVGQAGNGSTSAAGSCSRRSRCPTGHGGRWLTVMQGGESAEPIAVSDNPSKPWVR